MRKILLTTLSYILIFSAQAQDIHFSQFTNAPLTMNPALTGVFSGDYRFVGNFRSQWFSVPVPYTTFAATFDGRILPDRLEKDVLAGGVVFMHDKAGDSQMSTLNLGASLAFSKRITEQLFIGAGVMTTYGQRRFKTENLTFDDQYNGDVFDPNIISADLGNLTNTSFSYLDFSAGTNIRFQLTRRSWFNLGAALAHINRPRHSFMGADARLDIKWTGMADFSWQVHPKLDVLVQFLMHRQGVYRQTATIGGIRYHLNENPGRETAIFITSGYRWGDAVEIVAGVNYQTWQFALSYDINTSAFVPATNRNGAVELSLIYIARRVPRLPVVKICPIL